MIEFTWYPARILSKEDIFRIERNIWILNEMLDIEPKITNVLYASNAIHLLIPTNDIAQLLHYVFDNMRFEYD